MVIFMKKELKILFIVLGIIVVLGAIFFVIDYDRAKKQEKPIFCINIATYQDGGTKEYLGLGYKVIDFHTLEGFDDIKIGTWFINYNDFNEEMKVYETKFEEELRKNEEYTKMIQVNGKLYINNGEESTVTGRCGNMDGQITTNVKQDEVPTQDNQSNFSGYPEYQYGAENTIEVKINDKWFVFRLKDVKEDVFNAKIKRISEYNGITTVLIKGLESNDINHRGEFDFSIDNNTQILWIEPKSTKSSYTAIDSSKLKEGQNISITSTGYVLESSPAQLTKVTKVIVLEDEL